MFAQSVLKTWLHGKAISLSESTTLMDSLLAGEVPDGLIGGLLIANLQKGPSSDELAGMALSMRNHAVALEGLGFDVVDTCGTGGGRPTFNLSTGAAFVAAGAGAKIAKHGNRGVTSPCGSADVLESMGVVLHSDPAKLARIFMKCGMVFMFAQHHHSAMKAVMPVRKSLGIRSIFNLLGPLSNPAMATRQVIGVWDSSFLHPVAEALVKLNVENAFVVHATEGGLDEVSPCGQTEVVQVHGDQIRHFTVTPADFGQAAIDPIHLEPAIQIEGNADILRIALTEADSPRSMALIPNAACSLVVAGLAKNFTEGAEMARESIRSGSAFHKVESFVQATRDEAF